MQRRIVHSGGREVILVHTKVPYRGVVGSHIHCIRRDGHGIREAHLLPAGSGLPRKGGTRQERTRAAPQVPHMHASVCGTFVKAYARYVATGVRPELHPEFQRRVGPGIGIRGCHSARPNGAWTRLRNCGDRNARAGNLQIAAVISRSTLDAQSSRIPGCEAISPILTSSSGVPGFSTVQRDLNSSNHAAAGVRRSTRNCYRGTRSYFASRGRRGDQRFGWSRIR